MTTTEVEWDPETRGVALALEHHRAGLCPTCGMFPAAVCQAAANEFGFEAHGPFRCFATTAVVEARERMGEDVRAPAALMFTPQLKDGAANA